MWLRGPLVHCPLNPFGFQTRQALYVGVTVFDNSILINSMIIKG